MKRRLAAITTGAGYRSFIKRVSILVLCLFIATPLMAVTTVQQEDTQPNDPVFRDGPAAFYFWLGVAVVGGLAAVTIVPLVMLQIFAPIG